MSGVARNREEALGCKHAFPGGRAGTIRLVGQRQEGEYILTVADDGIGMRALKPGSMGLRLVRLMARQLDGTSDSTSGEWGTAVTVRFPA